MREGPGGPPLLVAAMVLDQQPFVAEHLDNLLVVFEEPVEAALQVNLHLVEPLFASAAGHLF